MNWHESINCRYSNTVAKFLPWNFITVTPADKVMYFSSVDGTTSSLQPDLNKWMFFQLWCKSWFDEMRAMSGMKCVVFLLILLHSR